jgi:hypothetical protein
MDVSLRWAMMGATIDTDRRGYQGGRGRVCCISSLWARAGAVVDFLRAGRRREAVERDRPRECVCARP